MFVQIRPNSLPVGTMRLPLTPPEPAIAHIIHIDHALQNENHWYQIVIDLEAKELIVLDSMGGTDTSTLKLLNSFITNEYAQQNRSLEYNANEWKTFTPKDICQPKQHNFNDCGAFSLLQATHVASSSSGRSAIMPPGKNEADMLWFRKRVLIEVRKRAGIILRIHTSKRNPRRGCGASRRSRHARYQRRPCQPLIPLREPAVVPPYPLWPMASNGQTSTNRQSEFSRGVPTPTAGGRGSDKRRLFPS
jgi:hypothetical protein